MSGTASFAAVDWGTTRFRAWLLDAAGAVVAERRSDEGMIALAREKYEGVLEGHLAEIGAEPVSYTHLTLPTIYSV